MKKLKKAMAILLSVLMLLGIIPFASVSAGAAAVVPDRVGTQSGTTGECTWTLDDDGVLTISGNGAMADYSSCGPWGGKIKNVVIESGVTSIGNSAFSGCNDLTNVTIPGSVMSIGNSAFYKCTSLTSITIPNSVTSIGWSAFYNCMGLTSVSIDNGVTIIGDEAFKGCISLTSIIIPDSVTNIGYGVFFECNGLTSITIPDSVTIIGFGAFDDTTWYNNQPDGLVYAGKVAYEYKGIMPSNTSIVLKDGTKGIADSAFYDCDGLTSITIPDNVTSIGKYAFVHCSCLTSVIIPESVTSIGSCAFNDCTGLASITIPDSVTSIGSFAFNDTEWYNNKPDGLVYAGKVAYTYKGTMPQNTSIAIKYGTKEIADFAFYDCTGLKSITIPNSVTSIGGSAFSGCKGLKSVDIPDSVTSIKQSTFEYCTSLTSVNIGNGVKIIGNYAFYNCSALKDIYYKGSEQDWGRINGDEMALTKIKYKSYKLVYTPNGEYKGYTIHFGIIHAKIESFSILTDSVQCKLEQRPEIKARLVLSDDGTADKELIEDYFKNKLSWIFSDASIAECNCKTITTSDDFRRADITFSVIPQKAGSCTVTADFSGDVTDENTIISGSCKISVKGSSIISLTEPETNVWSESNQTIAIFGSFELSAETKPDKDALSKEINAIRWSSSDSSILDAGDILCSGLFSEDFRSAKLLISAKMKGCGIVNLTATASDGSTAGCKITMEPEMQLESKELYPDKKDLIAEDFYTEGEKIITCHVSIPNSNYDYLTYFINNLTFELDTEKLKVTDNKPEVNADGKSATYIIKAIPKVDNDMVKITFTSPGGKEKSKVKTLDIYPSWGFKNFGAPTLFNYDYYNDLGIIDKCYAKNFKQHTAKNGLCFGMSVSALLNYYGRLNHRDYERNADSLYDIETTYDHEEVQKIIQFYYNSQFSNSYINEEKTFLKKGLHEQLRIIANMKRPFLLSLDSKEGHTIVGYEVQQGDYYSNVTERHYPKRVITYDPNCKKKEDATSRYFLFDDINDTWEIPYYYYSLEFSSDYERARITSASDEINTYTSTDFSGSGISGTLYETQNMFFELKTSINSHTIGGSYYSEDDDILAVHTCNESDSEDNLNPELNIYMPKIDRFSIKPIDSSSKLNASFKISEAADLKLQAESYDEMEINGDGSVSLMGNLGDFCVTTVLDAFEHKSYDGISVEGNCSNSFTTQVKDNGVLIKTDGINGIKISLYDVENDTNSPSVEISPTSSQLFLDTTSSGALKVSEDRDGDGEYEYVLASISTVSQLLIGDTNGDGNITISDVTEIQKYLAEFVQFTDEQLALADTNGDGIVNITDATHLQKYLAEFDGIVLGKQSR